MKNITIQSVEVVNFMCHSHLKIEFTKMMTCLCGRNGSGKSAIMIALGIIFGQRAKELDRGNNFKSLIKTGTNQAIIRVKINNYKNLKMEKYGNCILIEKKIREESTKTSISNYLGKIFNLKKNELEAILDCYNLKFSNPLNFLTQENSKRFLNLSSPRDLYDFYYVGTEFKEIEDDLQQSDILLKELKNKINEATDHLSIIEDKIVTLDVELKYHEFDAEAVLKRLENEQAWLYITERQNLIDDLSKQILDLENKILINEKERESLLENMNLKYEEISTKDETEELSRLNLQYHGVISEIEEFVKEKESIEKTIQQIISKDNTEALKKEVNKKEEKLKKKKKELEDLELQKEEAYHKMQLEKESNEENKQKGFILKKQIDYLRQNQFDQLKIRELENTKRIKQELSKHSFKDKVIGPLYEYITLKEHKWYKAVSLVLKNSLTNFIVFNNEDKNKLYGIFNKLKVDNSVSQMKSKRAYGGLKSNLGFKTFLSVLDIKDEVVSNQLITMYNIEQIILIENRGLAHATILKNPPNVDCAYTPSSDKIKLINGSLSDYRPRSDGFFWFEDNSSKIEKLQEEFNQLKYTHISKTEYDRVIHGLSTLTVEIEELEKKIRKILFELEAFSNLKENDTGILEKKLRLLTQNIKTLGTRKEGIDCEIKEIKTRKQSIEEKNVLLKENIRNLQEKSQNDVILVDSNAMILNNKKQVLFNNKTQATLYVEERINSVDKKPEIIPSLNQILRERKAANDFKVKLQEITPKETLEEEINNLKIKKENLLEIKEKFESCLKNTINTYNKRINKKEEIKEKNTQEAIDSFKEYTSRSGYEGIMVIDHESRQLDLKMRVHDSVIAGSKRTLSGGERSFAGVCFLLSMWKCFKCPVKVLDEFDVFMDSLNRKMTIQCLFEFFKENDVQVILITPLDTTDLQDPDCEIKVLKKAEK